MRPRVTLAAVLVLVVVSGAVVTGGGATAAPVVIDFESVSSGTLLTSQLSGQGVTFPQGVEVYECEPGGCISARSGTRVVRGEAAGEFQRDPFEAVFTNPQKVVTLWVRSDLQFSPGKNIIVTMNAYNEAGNPVGSRTINFSSSAGWQELTVGSLFGSANKTRVVVSGGQDDFAPTNFLAYDDLSFEGAEVEPSPTSTPDTTPPLLNLFSPFEGEVRTERNARLHAAVRDDGGLLAVSGFVSGPDGYSTPIDLCGSVFSGVCPEGLHTYDQSVSLAGGVNGIYTISLTACDHASNCTNRTRNFTVDVEEVSATDVIVSRVEVNQAVQERLSPVPAPGIAATLDSGVQLIPGKDMLVRWYVFGDGGAVNNFEARMLVTVFNRDGTTLHRSSTPNISLLFPPDLDPEPSATDLPKTLEAMRADMRATLNFVIPGEILDDAARIELRLRRGTRILTGFLQKAFVRPMRVGINVIRLSRFGVSTPPPSSETIESTIMDYLRQTYPVSEVRVLSTRDDVVPPDSRVRPIAGDCSYLLWLVSTVYGGDDTPVRSFTTDRNIITTMGVIDAISDAGGCAYLGDADDDDDRRGGTVISRPVGTTGAQEIGHQMGLIHASNAHSEAGGGRAETDWPHVHGTIGDRAFGVVLDQDIEPTDTRPLGVWTVRVVDGCPVDDPDDRYPTCTLSPLDPNRPHDFMSYGSSSIDISPLVGSQWVSQRTYSRLFAAIGLRSSPVYERRTVAARATGPSDARTDAFLVSAFIDQNGNATMLPVLSKPVPDFMLGEGGGAFRVTLLDDGGDVLARKAFDASQISVHDRVVHMIRGVLPMVDGVGTVRIEDTRTDDVLVEEDASANAPVVEITQPSGGETFPDGTIDVAWNASDADGGPLYHLVQFSPDGGWSWQGLQMVPPGSPMRTSVDVSELIEGTHGLIRVLTSDGINVSEDVTDVFFSVGTDDAPAESSRVDRRIGLRIRARRAIGVLRAPDGPDSCIAEARVTLKRGKKTVAAKRTNGSGRVRFRIPRKGRYRLVAVRERRAQLVCLRDVSPSRRRAKT